MDARKIVLAPGSDVTPSGASIRAMRLGMRALSAVSPALAARLAKRLWLTPPKLPLRDDARAFLATGERHELDVDGRRIATWRWGRGPTVILMHGWGGLGAQMIGFVEPLTRAGYRAILFDAPSHGASGPSRFGPRQTTLFEFSETLKGVMRDAGDVAAVVAHSGGSTAAAWAMRSTPELRGPRLALISPMASPSRYIKLFQLALGLSDDATSRFATQLEEELGFEWPELEVPAMAAHFTPAPTLLVHDRADRETSWSESEAIASSWPGARLHTTTGLGHNRILRDPGVIEAVIGFLRS